MQIRANWVNLKLDFTLKINEDLSETSPVHVIHTFYTKSKILDPSHERPYHRLDGLEFINEVTDLDSDERSTSNITDIP